MDKPHNQLEHTEPPHPVFGHNTDNYILRGLVDIEPLSPEIIPDHLKDSYAEGTIGESDLVRLTTAYLRHLCDTPENVGAIPTVELTKRHEARRQLASYLVELHMQAK